MTKSNIKIIAIIVSLSVFLVSNCSKTAETPVANKVDTQSYKSVGIVKSIDIEKGKVDVDHEDIPGYMSPMEMNEAVADRKLLDGLKAGDKVEFEILRKGAHVTYTKFTKIGEVAILDGPEIYKTNCAECHGLNGEGAKKGIPLTSGHALAHTAEEYAQQVADGKPNKMPAFRDKLNNEQIAEIVKYVRTILQAGITDTQRNEHHH